MSKKGIEFTIEVEQIDDYEKFNNNEELINELKDFINEVDYGAAIGFSNDNVLMFNGKLISYTKKECEAKYTLIKNEFVRILERYYGKIKPIDRMKLYFITF